MTNSKKRKFLATSLTATMVAAAVAPTAGFAAEAEQVFPDVPASHWAADAIKYLVNKGAIDGRPDGTYGPNDNMTRESAAKVLAVSLGLDIDENAKSSFTDVSGWAEPYIAAIEKLDIIEGAGDGKFNPKGTLTRAAMAKMVVKAYDLELDENADIDFPDNTGWSKEYIDIVASLGVLAGTDTGLANPKGNLTRAALAQLVHRAEVPGERVDVPKKEATELKVESVSAINGTEIQVKFNKAVDSATARDLDNYILSKNGTKYDGGVAIAALLEAAAVDGTNLKTTEFNATTNTITFKLATALENADKYSVDVRNGVLSSDKQGKVEKYTDTTKIFSDTAAPKLLETSINSDNKLKLVFDEPVTDIGVVKINDVTVYDPAGAYAAPTFSKVTGDYSVVLEDVIPAGLRGVGTHNVVAYSVKDAITVNTNVAAVVSGSYTISTDVTAPTIAKITQTKNDSRSFDIEFSEPVSYSTFETAVLNNKASLIVKKGNYTFTLGTDPAEYGVTQPDSKTWRVTFVADGSAVNPLYASNDTSATLSVELAGYKDDANNVGNKYNGTVTLAKDMAAPLIKPGLENKIDASGNLVVKLNKAVTPVGTLDANKVKVTDKDGISRTVTSVTLSGTDELVISLDGITTTALANAKAPFTVTLSAGLVKSSENVQNAAGSVVIGKDTVSAPVVAGVNSAIASSTEVNGVYVNTITVTYANAMSASATNLANYTLDGKSLTGATIAMDNDDKVVTITLPEGFARVDNQQLLEISKNVKTKTGSVIVASEATKAPYTSLVTLVDNTQPTLEKAEFLVTDTNKDTQTKKVKLTFSENLAAVTDNPDTIADFAVMIGGTAHSIANVTDGTPNDKVVIIELTQDIALTNTVDVKLVGITANNTAIDIKDEKGNVAKAGTVRVSGKVLQ